MQRLISLVLILSPFTSYGDLLYSINKNRSSEGFSIDICGMMIVSSILRAFFWISDRYENALLMQSLNMIVLQCMLLYSCLKYRPIQQIGSKRPYALWQWEEKRVYWEFLFYFTIITAGFHLLLGSWSVYTRLLGILALGLESTLPIPQILENHRRRSVVGLRISVIGSWLLGDFLKIIYYFSSQNISGLFRIFAVFQAACDCYVGYQFHLYKDNFLARSDV